MKSTAAAQLLQRITEALKKSLKKSAYEGVGGRIIGCHLEGFIQNFKMAFSSGEFDCG